MNATTVTAFSWTPVLGIGLALVPIVTVVGNVLVVLAIVMDRTLRTTTNFLLLSLAVADLLVGVIVMPPSIYLVMNNLEWYLPPLFCTIFTFSDVTASTASIVHLTAISADRFFAVLRHVEYATRRHRRRVRVFIICTWILSILVGLPLVLILDPTEHVNSSICGIHNHDYMLYGSIFAFYIPAAVMIVLYCLVFSRLHNRLQSCRFQEATAAQVVQFSQRMIPDGCRSGTTSKKNWDLSWALPFVRTLEEKAKNPRNDNISRRDLRELTVILTRLEKEETMCVSGGSSELSLDQTPSSGSENAPCEVDRSRTTFSRTMSIARSPKSSQRSRTRSKSRDALSLHDIICKCRWKDAFFLCGSNRISSSRKLAAKRLKQMRTRAYKLLMKMRSKQGIAIRKENRATKLVATVMLVFLICWVPFFTTNLVKVVYLRTDQPWPQEAEVVFVVSTWLGYINSALNPIIYTLINRRFRNAFAKLLTCRTVMNYRKWTRFQSARRRSSRFASWFISRRETIQKECPFNLRRVENGLQLDGIMLELNLPVEQKYWTDSPSAHESDVIL